MSFHRLLIANRGEIAIRIARAAGETGLAAVAIHPVDDALSLHVPAADEAYEIPGRGARAYLDIEAVIAAAKATGCDALHPGYGFLSENASLARRCAEDGIVFVGPSPDALDLFGDKAKAKALARSCGVPVIEGTSGPTTLDEANAFFASLGADGAVMIKAIAGGGGRGMRIVEDASKLAEAYARCQSEAKAAFGNDHVYVERLIRKARHIEVQIIGDRSGAISHLWERECTIQRRNQKLIEVAPSPSLSDGLRSRIIDAARQLAAAARYDNLGTFEFLVDDEDAGTDRAFAFIEANPRLQVEHTVTEEVLGVDLVKSQLAVAAGATLASLGLSQAAIPAPRGYAMQLRINMEVMDEKGLTRPTGGTLAVRSAVRPGCAGRYLRLLRIQDKCGLRLASRQGHRSFACPKLVRCRAQGRTCFARISHRRCRYQYSIHLGSAGPSRFHRQPHQHQFHRYPCCRAGRRDEGNRATAVLRNRARCRRSFFQSRRTRDRSGGIPAGAGAAARHNRRNRGC